MDDFGSRFPPDPTAGRDDHAEAVAPGRLCEATSQPFVAYPRPRRPIVGRVRYWLLLSWRNLAEVSSQRTGGGANSPTSRSDPPL